MPQIFEYIKIAFMNIMGNKGRSVLTMLGIIIGISSVIMIITIGQGITNEVNGELNSLAGGQLYLYADSGDDGNVISFTEEDFDLLIEKIPHIKGVTPSVSLNGTAYGKKGEFEASVSAGTESLEYTSGDAIIKGKYFTKEDYLSGKYVCILTESSAISLFGTTDVVGMSFELSLYGTSKDYTIVGIREDNASRLMSMFQYGEGQINMEIPVSSLLGFGFDMEEYSGFYIIGESPEYSTFIAENAIALLEAKYNVRGQGLISVQNFNDSMEQINSVLNYITIFVVFVAAISLLVGGIGVMNIMLVSVTERTREIGIRKALGARTGSILLQFLSESAIITLVGGLIGIFIGTSGAFLICSILDIQAGLSLSVIGGASLFSSAVGIFFGIYPARKAAKLSPIEALRHE